MDQYELTYKYYNMISKNSKQNIIVVIVLWEVLIWIIEFWDIIQRIILDLIHLLLLFINLAKFAGV
jgi:hypothetical protein